MEGMYCVKSNFTKNHSYANYLIVKLLCDAWRKPVFHRSLHPLFYSFFLT